MGMIPKLCLGIMPKLGSSNVRLIKSRDVLTLTGLSADQLREWTVRRRLIQPDFPAARQGQQALFGWQTVLLLRLAVVMRIFRVLLLTALLDLTRSRFHAVFLSSVVFGLIHAPLALMQPVVHGDWPILQSAAQAYAPDFLLQTLAGLILGVLWLRTGSIGLVVVTHAIMNVGPTLLTGF